MRVHFTWPMHKQMLIMWMAGKTTEAIARRIGVAYNTIQKERQRLKLPRAYSCIKHADAIAEARQRVTTWLLRGYIDARR